MASDDSNHDDGDLAARLEALRRGVGLRLDVHGEWWQGSDPFEHGGLIEALDRGIALHPDTQEPIVYIGDKWCYFQSEDLPFIVQRLDFDGTTLWARLNTRERAEIPRDGFEFRGECVVVALGGGRVARLTRTAQSRLADALRETDDGLFLRYGDQDYPIGEGST